MLNRHKHPSRRREVPCSALSGRCTPGASLLVSLTSNFKHHLACHQLAFHIQCFPGDGDTQLCGRQNPLTARARSLTCSVPCCVQDVSESSHAPLHAANVLWQRLLPGRRPRALSSGASIECHVPGSRWPVISVRLHGQGGADLATLRLWRAARVA